jgi:hypothetical protein
MTDASTGAIGARSWAQSRVMDKFLDGLCEIGRSGTATPADLAAGRTRSIAWSGPVPCRLTYSNQEGQPTSGGAPGTIPGILYFSLPAGTPVDENDVIRYPVSTGRHYLIVDFPGPLQGRLTLVARVQRGSV